MKPLLTTSLVAFIIVMFSNLLSVNAQSWSLTGNSGTTSSNFLGTTDNKKLNIRTNNQNRMTITSAGKIGIGTTAPSQELHLVGTMQIDRSSIGGNTTPGLILNGLANNIVTILKVDGVQKSAYGYDVSTDDFLIATDDVGLRPDFIINRTNGFIGLNTKTPGSRLHIQDGDLEITNGTENFFLRTNATGQFQLIPNSSGNTVALTIDDTNGDVGIGTTSPSNKLDVNGGANFLGNIGVQTAANTRTIQCGSTQGALIGIGTAEYIQDAGSSTLSTANDWTPVTDNLYSLGTSSFRWQDVWAVDGSINTSDARMKTNVKDINYGLSEIMKLRPVSFQWKNDQSYTKLGVIAQEIQTVLPEVVRDWDYVIDEKTGAKTKVASEKMGVMYDDIIPVLIKGIQEQQQQIEELKAEVASLKQESETRNQDNNTGITNSQSAILEQNIPNPANQTTIIRFSIPSSANEAHLIITDVNGKTVREFNNLAGQSQIEVSTLNLVSGTYQYSLYLDRKKVDTKQMLVNK